jgi:BMFP domain-containing protein YqiC
MQNKNEFSGDFAKFINGVVGTFAGMGREASENARDRTREFFGGLDFVSREEFEAVKELAQKAREEADSLKARVEALEKAASSSSRGKASAGKASPGKASPTKRPRAKSGPNPDA